MRMRARGSLLGLVTGVLLLLVLGGSAAQAAEFPSIEKLVAVNCNAEHENCAHKVVEKELSNYPIYAAILGKQRYSVTEEPKTEAESRLEGFNQAGGRVPFGITDFKVATIGPKGEPTGELPEEIPTSLVTHLRTDVAPGLATSPTAMPLCSGQSFGETETGEAFGKEPLPKSGLFTAPTCVKASEIGVNEATVYVEAPKVHPPEAEGTAKFDLGLSGKVYNLEPPKGRAALYGVALKLPKELTKAKLKAAFEAEPLPGEEPGKKLTEEALENEQWYAHTLIEGNVEWGRESSGTGFGDFHDYFEIAVSPELPLVSSRLTFYGNRSGETGQAGDFITNATSCPGHNTTSLKLTDKEGVTVTRAYTTLVHLEGCNLLSFEPGFSIGSTPSTADSPNELSAEATLPHNPKANDESQVKSASFTLPEGMTLNPSAAHGLQACTPKQAHQEGTVFGPQFGVECPAGSKIGTVNLNVPTLPDGSLTGNVYLAAPESGTITGPPYDIYVVANSEKYGVSVRLFGETIPNEATGQVTTFFRNPPEQPFTSITLHFDRGALSPIANPLLCGTPIGTASFEPTSAPGSTQAVAFGATITGCGSATPPFAPTQSTSNQSNVPGANTSFTFALTRPDGQQYFSSVSTTLPEGLVGLIPTATECSESVANSEGEECPANSKLGTATVVAGSGATPFRFEGGSVYLTGPYKGAPFGLSIKVPAVAGPFNLGNVVARAAINIDQYSGRVVTTDTEVPRIRRGIPDRIREIVIAINKQGFLINPTSCNPLSTESTASGFTTVAGAAGTAVKLANAPFQLANCSAQAFKPSFTAATSAKTSRLNGASLETTIKETKGQSNIKSVLVQLPKQLPSRLTTLNKACLEATFNSGYRNCPSGGFVGTVRASTPTLPGKLSGPAILVSHGGEAFPDLDLILEGDGVKVVLVGNTDIKKGITKTHFAAPPDVPVSSITVNLPVGPHSALAAYGSFCRTPLVMPTTIEGQNGKVVKQNTKIKVKGCGVQIVGHKVVGHTLFLTIKTFAAGRVSVSGGGHGTVHRHYRGAMGRASIRINLSSGRHRIRVGFVPRNRKVGKSAASVTVRAR